MADPSTALMDNASAIQVTKHPEHQSTMKHVHRAYHWICPCVGCGDTVVSRVPGSENLRTSLRSLLDDSNLQNFREGRRRPREPFLP